MKNAFRERLLRADKLFGLFAVSNSSQVIEALADSGFDFLLFDFEHAPHSLPTLQGQLCALGGSRTAAIVRVPGVDLSVFKPLLDLGVEGLMVPNVHDAQIAEAAVRCLRYPPRGVRGVAGTVRATRYGRDAGYLSQSEERHSLIVQIESRAGVDNLESIAAVDGVDAVFVGPNDLASDLGLLDQPGHPKVVETVEACLERIRQAGKPAGVLCSEMESERYMNRGARMVALGSDLGLLVKAADALSLRQQPHRS